MSSSFDLPSPSLIAPGATGMPGNRTFYVQAIEESVVVTLKLEKTQVAALAQYMAELLADLPPVDDSAVPRDVDIVEPAVPEWTVGTIGVAFDESRDRMVVTFQEVLGEDEDEEDASLATFTITREQALGFVRRSAELVASGRPPCTLCGRPMDPEGHVCIKTNGHLH